VRAIVVGAGINGVTTAIELTRRGHEVVLVDPGPLPHPLAASTDISKAVRAAYGTDEDYTELAERSIPIWRKWNIDLGVELYHEVGFLFMRQREMQPGDFEYESFKMLEKRGHAVERINASQLRARFPAWNEDRFCDGFLDREAGYAESARIVAALIERAKSLGIKLIERARFAALNERAGVVNGVLVEPAVIPSEVEGSRDGSFEVAQRDPSASFGITRVEGDAVVIATGAWTPFLLPFTKPFLRATGQAVFHLQPEQPELFTAKQFPVFGADITSTGYYGFPLNRDGVVKVANHGPGREMSPDSPRRFVTAEEENNLREFLAWSFPSLADSRIVYTRVCFYCDTHDGNFWIARDPERKGLVVAAGDCGHGFKFAPVLGEIISDVVEERENALSHKFRWRPEIGPDVQKEAARFSPSS
jgi:glycine/D-amino acid oxidase-like deaminating enzyme